MRISANNPAYKHFISLNNGIYYFNFLLFFKNIPFKATILFLFNFLFLSNLYSQVIIKEKVGIKNLRGINTVTQYWPCDGIKPTKDGINFLQYVWTGSRYPLHPGRQNIGSFYIEKNKYYTFRIIEGNQYCHFNREFHDGTPPIIIENEITVLGRDLYAKDIEGNLVEDSIGFIDCDNNPFYVAMYNYDYTIIFEEILNREERVVYTIEPEGE